MFMSLNAHKILAPTLNLGESTLVFEVLVEASERIKRGQPLLCLRIDEREIRLSAPCHGRVNKIFVKPGDIVPGKALLALIEAFEVAEYHPDGAEVSPETELGENGRRGLERLGEKVFGDGFSRELFDAPTRNQGQQMSSVKQNPLTANMKEGVPPKMNASAAQNEPAVEKLTEDAGKDAELQKQLGNQLQQQLGLTPAPSSAPTNRPG